MRLVRDNVSAFARVQASSEFFVMYRYSRPVRYTYFSATGQAEIEVELTSVEPQDTHGSAVHPGAARARHLDLEDAEKAVVPARQSDEEEVKK